MFFFVDIASISSFLSFLSRKVSNQRALPVFWPYRWWNRRKFWSKDQTDRGRRGIPSESHDTSLRLSPSSPPHSSPSPLTRYFIVKLGPEEHQKRMTRPAGRRRVPELGQIKSPSRISGSPNTHTQWHNPSLQALITSCNKVSCNASIWTGMHLLLADRWSYLCGCSYTNLWFDPLHHQVRAADNI